MTAGAALSRGARDRRSDLVDTLRRDGALHDPRWVDAFLTVERHAFLGAFFVPEGDRWSAVERGDPGWLDHVYRDEVLVTQLDGDQDRWRWARRHGPVAGVPTSSSSMPSIMAIMLEDLLVRDGDTVLEVGTGTGYNAALLCRGLGDAHVSTVDVDRDVAAKAAEALARNGFRPTCADGDGAAGLPERAPFDRVLLTCSVSRVPAALIAQTRPGGLVVTTLNRPIGAGLVRLVVRSATRARGRVLPADGRFMPLRSHRLPDARDLFDRLPPAEGEASPTGLPIGAVLRPRSPFEFFAGLVLPGVLPFRDPGGEGTYLVHPDGSWVCHYPWRGGFAVDQGGPRRLWDEVEAGHRRWKELGRPTRTRFGITVDDAGQELWLDSPDSGERWAL